MATKTLIPLYSTIAKLFLFISFRSGINAFVLNYDGQSSIFNSPFGINLPPTSFSPPISTQPQYSTMGSQDGTLMTSMYPTGSSGLSIAGDPLQLPILPPFINPWQMFQPFNFGPPSILGQVGLPIPVPDPNSNPSIFDSQIFPQVFGPVAGSQVFNPYIKYGYQPHITSEGFPFNYYEYPSSYNPFWTPSVNHVENTYTTNDDNNEWYMPSENWDPWGHDWDDSWDPPRVSAPLRDTMFSYATPQQFSWDDVNYSWGEPGNPWGEVIAPWGDAESAWNEVDYPYGEPDRWGLYGYENPWSSIDDDYRNRRDAVQDNIACPRGGERFTMGGDIEATCSEPFLSTVPTRVGCFCIEGYVRDDGGNCIPREACHVRPVTRKLYRREESSCSPGTAYKKKCDVCVCKIDGSEDGCTVDRECLPGETDQDAFKCTFGDLYAIKDYLCFCNDDGLTVTCQKFTEGESVCPGKDEIFAKKTGETYCNPFGDSPITAKSDWSEYGCFCKEGYARNFLNDCVSVESCNTFMFE